MPAESAVRARGGRRWSLRGRLIALVLGIAAVALIAVDVVVPLNVRAALISGRSAVLTSVMGSLATPGHTFVDQQVLTRLSNASPLGGEIGWTKVSVDGIAQVWLPAASNRDSNPKVGSPPSTTVPRMVPDATQSGRQYLTLGAEIQDYATGRPAGFLVGWISMDDVSATVRRLVILELLISTGLLLLIGAAAGLIIRRALRPLEAMATAADGIAAGDLSRRVDLGPPGTEVGRLGAAFNGMVDGIGGLLAERAANEARLRQFIADASHELRTPVAAIRGYTDLYRAGALPEEVAVARAMDRMGFESRRMGALVDDLLMLTQADADESGSREPVDLADLLTGVVDDAAAIDRARIWRLAGAQTDAIVLGDRLRLHQIFANLLANIRTHTPAGTVATVSLLTTETEVAVTVSDNGPGVADSDLPRLFDRFYRADPSRSRERGGTGLGLSIAGAIARSHRGRITASATPGGGLTMTVLLPRAGRPADTRSAVPQ